MTYDATERSPHSGSPVEFYLFQRGVQSWTWTSADISITYNSKTYTPYPISRPSIAIEGRVGVDDLEITVPRNDPVAAMFIQLVPASTVFVTVYRSHRGDLTDVKIPWQGRVRSVRWAGSEAVLMCDLITNALGQEGPRKLHQRLCPHMLYDHRCKVPPEDFSVAGVVGSVQQNGEVISVAAAATEEDGYFAPGYVQRGDDDFRMVTNHTGDLLTLLVPYENLLPGEALIVFAGCDRSKTMCFKRFNNVPNHGGEPYLPQRNPFNNGVGSVTLLSDGADAGEAVITGDGSDGLP